MNRKKGINITKIELVGGKKFPNACVTIDTHTCNSSNGATMLKTYL